MRELGIGLATSVVYMPGHLPGIRLRPGERVTVSEGRNFVTTEVDRLGTVPKGSKLIGDFFLGDKLYGRFTELQLPNGERLPFCGTLWGWEVPGPGQKLHPGSKPGALKVYPLAFVKPMFDSH